MRNDLSKTGYSSEEEYFHRVQKILLQRLREEEAARKKTPMDSSEDPSLDSPEETLQKESA